MKKIETPILKVTEEYMRLINIKPHIEALKNIESPISAPWIKLYYECLDEAMKNCEVDLGDNGTSSRDVQSDAQNNI